MTVPLNLNKRRSVTSSSLESHTICLHRFKTSTVLTCAPSKHVGNARENRKGLLQNIRKGLLPNNNTSHSC